MNFDSDTRVIGIAVRCLHCRADESFGRPIMHAVHELGYVLEAH